MHHSKFIVRTIGLFSVGGYCYLLKKDWDDLKEKSKTNNKNNK